MATMTERTPIVPGANINMSTSTAPEKPALSRRGALCRIGTVLAILPMSLVFFSCTSGEKHERILRYAVSTDITSLDPVRVTEDNPRLISEQIMETLVTYDNQLRLRPLLADSWFPLDGGREWVFRLHPKVRFQNDQVFGDKPRYLNASDVRFSLERLLNPKTQTLGAFVLSDIVQGAADYYAGKSATVHGIIVKDPLTIEFKLTKPYALFPARLSLPFCAIVPREAVQHYGAQFGTHPVGTGPFEFDSWDFARGEIRLGRSPFYWRPIQTNLDGVDFMTVKTAASQLADAIQGRIDAFEAGPTVYHQIVTPDGQLSRQFSFAKILKSPILTLHFVGFNFERTLCRDKNLRLACNYAVDKDQLCKYVLEGLATPSNGPLPPEIMGGDNSVLYPHNLKKARQLLAKSSYRGQTLTLMTDNSTSSVAVSEFLQAQLGSLGVKIRIDKNTESVWLDKLSKGDFDLAKLYFAFDYPAPDNGLSQFLQSNYAPAGPNFLRYSHKGFDNMYDRALQQVNPEKARTSFAQLQNIIRKDAPWIFLYSPLRVIVIRNNIQGIKINSLSFSLMLYDAMESEAGR